MMKSIIVRKTLIDDFGDSTSVRIKHLLNILGWFCKFFRSH